MEECFKKTTLDRWRTNVYPVMKPADVDDNEHPQVPLSYCYSVISFASLKWPF